MISESYLLSFIIILCTDICLNQEKTMIARRNIPVRHLIKEDFAMAHEIYINFFSDTIEIEDPSNEDQWIEALKPSCDDFAQQHYRLEYYRDRGDELSDDRKQELSEGIIQAIKAFKEDPRSAGDSWKEAWAEHFMEAVYGVTEDMLGHDNDQMSALHENNFDELYQSLEEAMEELDCPVADAESIVELLKDYTCEKMQEHDHSGPMDWVGDEMIHFTYTPRKEGDSQHNSDLMLESNQLVDGPDEHLFRLLTLMQVNGSDLIDDFEIDYTDKKALLRWDTVLDCSFDKGSVFSRNDVAEVLENFGQCGLPMWIGRVSVNGLLNVNFNEPLQLKGGMVGAHDYINGAGHMLEMGEHVVILAPSQTLDAETGYKVLDTYGVFQRTLNATVTALAPSDNKKEMHPAEASPSP
jgi:hypothetical protein